MAVIAILATIGMNMFPENMDDYLGRGKRHVVVNEKTASLDAKYYGNNGFEII